MLLTSYRYLANDKKCIPSTRFLPVLSINTLKESSQLPFAWCNAKCSSDFMKFLGTTFTIHILRITLYNELLYEENNLVCLYIIATLVENHFISDSTVLFPTYVYLNKEYSCGLCYYVVMCYSNHQEWRENYISMKGQ